MLLYDHFGKRNDNIRKKNMRKKCKLSNFLVPKQNSHTQQQPMTTTILTLIPFIMMA